MVQAALPDAGSRLEAARGLLRRMEDRSQVTRPGAVPEVDGRVLPVAGPLARLLPSGGLRRGSTVSVVAGPGSTSLLFGLLAGASAGGAWAGVVGRPGLGLVAAAEVGIRLERLALVPHPGRHLVGVTAALLDGLDLVAVAGVQRAGVRAADRQRLVARARQRGAVLLALGPWPGADLELGGGRAEWQGLVGGGGGRLCARRLEVRVDGRGVGPSGRRATMLLPALDGGISAVAVDDAVDDDDGATGAGDAVEPAQVPARVAR